MSLEETEEGEIWSASQTLQLAALNDCLYRNMFKYERIAIMDTDELLVPHNLVENGLVKLFK